MEKKTRKTKITMLDGGTKRTLPRTLWTSIFLMTALSIRRGGGSEGGLLFPQIAEGIAHKIDQRCIGKGREKLTGFKNRFDSSQRVFACLSAAA